MQNIIQQLFFMVSLSLSAQVSFADIPNFNDFKNVHQKKQAFFNYMLPIAQKVNGKILETRSRLILLQDKKYLTPTDMNWIIQTGKQYSLKIDKSNLQFKQLLERVDIIPVSMILAQAANESAWGSSKFARKGNNFFGQWCYKKNCGLVPSKRGKGKVNEVRKFSSVYNSVEAYSLNLNSNSHYDTFRKLRSSLRIKENKLSGEKLANGLLRYSVKGSTYVKEIQQLITTNHLNRYESIG